MSGKFDLLDRILPKLKRKGHRYFTFFYSRGSPITKRELFSESFSSLVRPSTLLLFNLYELSTTLRQANFHGLGDNLSINYPMFLEPQHVSCIDTVVDLWIPCEDS